MALGDPYITATELKSYLKITDAADDTEITNAVNACSRAIEKHCHRQFNQASSATARVYYSRSSCLAQVDDISTTTGLVIKTDDTDDGTYETTWAASDYQLEPLNGIVDGETGWPYWKIRSVGGRVFPTGGDRAPIEVTARWGWAAVPAPVKQAAYVLAADTFKLSGAPFGVAGMGEWGMIRVRPNSKAAEFLGPYQLEPVLVG